jgi:hypothetical protein
MKIGELTMSDYHEPYEQLDSEDHNIVRALHSLKEEIEAVNWYHQRLSVCKDEQLKKILEHNRNEEIEHACMALEWLRRKMPEWDEHMKEYFFTKEDITSIEENETEKKEWHPDLGIKSLKD